METDIVFNLTKMCTFTMIYLSIDLFINNLTDKVNIIIQFTSEKPFNRNVQKQLHRYLQLHYTTYILYLETETKLKSNFIT